MPDIIIEQAIYGSLDTGGYRFLARSSGFQEDWLPAAQQLCADFGERPAGVRCPACVFAQPFGKKHVAVVQVADQGTDDTGRPGALGFRLLIVPIGSYNHLGDPFAIAEQFPPTWEDRGELPALSWLEASLPYRTVAEIQRVLKRAEGPALLGGAQALVDGGQLIFQRPDPDTELMRGLWMLLPASTRRALWPASFAFGNTLAFDALVVARADGADGAAYEGYVSEQQAEEYPQGYYELNLQIAVEAGDQAELDALFARRSRAQTWRLGLILLVVVSALLLCTQLLQAPKTPPVKHAPKEDIQKQPHPKGDHGR